MVTGQNIQCVTDRVRKLFRHQTRTDLFSAVIEMPDAWKIKTLRRLPCFALIVGFEHRNPNNQDFRSVASLRNFLSFIPESLRAVNTPAASGREKRQHARFRSV